MLKDLEKQKATSVAPALTAMKRYLKEAHEYRRMKGDQQLSEARRGKAQFFQPDGDRDVTKTEQQQGRTFTHQQVIKKLQRLNERLYFERCTAFPDKLGIYIPHKEGSYKGNLLHLMGMPWGEVPQYSTRKPDPLGKTFMVEKRGWMKILVDLARLKLIDLERACQVFEVDKTQVSRNASLLLGRHKA